MLFAEQLMRHQPLPRAKGPATLKGLSLLLAGQMAHPISRVLVGLRGALVDHAIPEALVRKGGRTQGGHIEGEALDHVCLAQQAAPRIIEGFPHAETILGGGHIGEQVHVSRELVCERVCLWQEQAFLAHRLPHRLIRNLAGASF